MSTSTVRAYAKLWLGVVVVVERPHRARQGGGNGDGDHRAGDQQGAPGRRERAESEPPEPAGQRLEQRGASVASTAAAGMTGLRRCRVAGRRGSWQPGS